MITVLVSGASGIVGYGCLKSLRDIGKYRLIGTSIYDDLVAKKFCDTFILAPHTDSQDYVDWLISNIQQYNVDILIPGIEIDMYKWNKHREELERAGAKLLLNSEKLISLCENKWNFYLSLKEQMLEIAIPTYMEKNYETIINKLGEPFIMKPQSGYGAKGVTLIHDKEDYMYYRKKYEDAMVQQYVKGEEYTIGAMYDTRSRLCAYICMQRELGRGGYTEKAQVIDMPQMKEYLIRLGEIFKPIGITNFQFIGIGENLKLLEINPRISSSSYMRTKFGYNECEMGIQFVLENMVPKQPAIKKGRAVRYIEEVVEYDRDNI